MASDKAKFFLKDRKPYIVAELGSCHLGSKDKLFELVDRCIDLGADAVKIQIFPDTEQYTKSNVFLPDDHIEKLVKKYASKIDLGFSPFPKRNIIPELIEKFKFVKMARSLAMGVDAKFFIDYSKIKHPGLLSVGSFSYMDLFSKERWNYDIALFCHAINGHTVYPVEYQLEYGTIAFNTKCDGLSDHSLATEIFLGKQTQITWLEKHVMLDGQLRNSCGDAAFALDMKDFAKYIKSVKR